MSTNSDSSLGKFTLWGEIETQLKNLDKENERSLEYIIDLMNYITRNIYENHKYYWILKSDEKKYFLKKITKSIINGRYKNNVKKWNEQTFRTHFNTNKRKREETDQENKEPIQPEFLTDTDISEEDLETIQDNASSKKIRLNSSKGIKTRNDKSKQ
jgi:hypothetical protein